MNREVDVIPSGNPNDPGSFRANFFFKSAGTKTIYARNVADPNDYDVITFDYYPERMVIDTIKFPCMFPGGEISSDNFNFIPIEDKFDVNKVLAYMFNNKDASCINTPQEGGCGLCNSLYFYQICQPLSDAILSGITNAPLFSNPLEINNILYNLGVIAGIYKNLKCDCIIHDILAKINGWTIYDISDFCIPSVFERCCPSNLITPPPENVCKAMKEPRDIANKLGGIGAGFLNSMMDTNLGEKWYLGFIKVGAELTGMRLNIRNSSLTFSQDNSSSGGHYTLRIDVEGGDIMIRGWANVYLLLDTLHFTDTFTGYWNNFNLQFDIIPEMVYDTDLGKYKVYFRIENNSELSQPIMFVDQWIVLGVSLTPILNWIAADYINSNTWARKSPEKVVNNLFKPLVLRKINNYLNNLGVHASYNTLDDVPIERIYFTSEGNYRCFDGSSANSTLMVEIPPIYADNP